MSFALLMLGTVIVWLLSIHSLAESPPPQGDETN